MNDPALLKQKMRDLFLDFDSDQSGASSFDEFSAGMQNLKLAVDLTPEQMRVLFRVLDLDGSGQVSALGRIVIGLCQPRSMSSLRHSPSAPCAERCATHAE